MEELVEQMKSVLASVFSLYLKTHNYHWNVTGPDFAQYHKFFGDFYEELHDSVDLYAEHIRAIGEYAPGSLKRFSELTRISDETNIPSPHFMFVKLASDNDILIAELYDTRNMADSMSQYGLVNFLEDRIDYHEKMRWMLSSVSKSEKR